jgi:hypothetical protein
MFQTHTQQSLNLTQLGTYRSFAMEKGGRGFLGIKIQGAIFGGDFWNMRR